MLHRIQMVTNLDNKTAMLPTIYCGTYLGIKSEGLQSSGTEGGIDWENGRHTYLSTYASYVLIQMLTALLP